MTRINFELGGIQDGEGVSTTTLTDCDYNVESIRNLAEALRKKCGLDFQTVFEDERPGVQSPRYCLLRNDRLRVLISNSPREVREAMLTRSWDRGYMDERIGYQVLTGYVEGDFGNGEAASIKGLIEQYAQKTRREFHVCSDAESARIDTR